MRVTHRGNPSFCQQDYAKCSWPGLGPHGSEEVAQLLDSFNEQSWASALAAACDPRLTVLSLSHFLPFLELMPEKRYLTYPNLVCRIISGSCPRPILPIHPPGSWHMVMLVQVKAVGSKLLGTRVKALQPDLHLFGLWPYSVQAQLFCSSAQLCLSGISCCI